MTRRIRALVVDDSAFVRKVVREVLLASNIEVVDVARDGLEALEKIQRLEPDVVTLDLMMPNLDGLGVLDQLAQVPHPPAVVVVSIAGAESEMGVEALQRGAVALVTKPTALATPRLYELGRELAEAVRIAALVSPSALRLRSPPVRPTPVRAPKRTVATEIVLIGTSTGGPQALTQLIGELPEDFPVPIAVVVHIPPGYTEPLARRLDASSSLRVVEASEGLLLAPGTVTIARAGMHLKLDRRPDGFRAHLDINPLSTPHRPSVDVLFETAATACGAGVLGVVLTGMGDDGLAGAHAIHARGGRIITESEASCVVFGMPRVVREAGLSEREAPLYDMARVIVESL